MQPEITYDWLERLTNIYRAWRGRRRPLLTPFEQVIMAAVEQRLAPPMAQILRDQLTRFNDVQRGPTDLDSNKRTICLYCFKRGIPCLDFPIRFPGREGDFKLAEVKVKHSKGTITATLEGANGVMFLIDFRSLQNIFEPEGEYTIQSVEVFL